MLVASTVAKMAGPRVERSAEAEAAMMVVPMAGSSVDMWVVGRAEAMAELSVAWLADCSVGPMGNQLVGTTDYLSAAWTVVKKAVGSAHP